MNTLGDLSDLRFFFGGHSHPSGGSQETFGIAGFSGAMPENDTTPPSYGPADGAVPDVFQPAPVPPRRGRRTLVLPAATAALALLVGGIGAGYAVAKQQGSAGSATTPQSSSNVLLTPGYGQDPGIAQLPDSPYSYYGQGDGSGDGSGQSSTGQGSSTDTTSQASGSQLTGLVRIVSSMKYDGAEAAGTGLVLTSDGEVVTNHHVVEGATTVKVTVMTTGKTYTAKVVGTDTTADVAVLQLQDASGLDTVTTDTDGISTGDAVTAVGDGNGTVDYLSAATGQVLATDQSITTQSEGTAEGENLTGLIEISSDVVGGFSGGATYDADGQVVGMTTAASSGGDVVGYAIPIAKVTTIADDIENGVKDTTYSYGYPAFLGVGLGDGTVVQGVYDGTSAAEAGIAAGDTITAVDGTTVTGASQLHQLIAAHTPGDDVRITWTDSNGSSHSATVSLGKGPIA
jgi:S1-C subfamily serine protease